MAFFTTNSPITIQLIGMDTLDYMIISLLGTPYKWGGNSVIEGLDCSGLVCELLKTQGLIGNKEDFSASRLFDVFKEYPTTKAKRGTLVFYGKNLASISHVAYCINPTQIIEAGGGNADTITLAQAIARQACVRIRPIKYRNDFLAMVNPMRTTQDGE